MQFFVDFASIFAPLRSVLSSRGRLFPFPSANFPFPSANFPFPSATFPFPSANFPFPSDIKILLGRQGGPKRPQRPPKTSPRRSQDPPRGAQVTPKTAPKHTLYYILHIILLVELAHAHAVHYSAVKDVAAPGNCLTAAE